MKKLSLEWTKGLSEKEKEEFEQMVRRSLVVPRLLGIIKEWELELSNKETSEDYSDAAWAYKQAHRNGDRSRIKKLKDLLSFKEG
jgi:hypothetical protein